MTYLSKALDLYKLIGQRQIVFALEKYYHESVVMIAATGEKWVGKEVNREFENRWMNLIQEIHDSGVSAISSDEEDNITIVESWVDVTLKDGTRVKLEEIARQKWQQNQIVEQRFYFKSNQV